MGSRCEVEVTVGSARELKNVNWRDGGELKPYAVLWLDSSESVKCSTRVDLDNGDRPVWDEKLVLPLPSGSRLDDAVLCVDVVHAGAPQPLLVGSARLPLREESDRVSRSLRLKRPSGRPQGRLDVRVAVRQSRDAARGYYPGAPHPPAMASRDPYAAPGYPASGYGAAQQQPAYGAPATEEKGMGMGAGLAAGVLGGLALAGGASYVENKFEERVAERVEEDSYGGGYGDYGGDDDY